VINSNRKFYLIILFALLLGILVDYLFYGKPIGISFFIFVFIFLILSLFLVKKFNQKLKREQILIAIFLVLLSGGMFLRLCPFLRFFNFTGSLYLLFLFLGLFSKKQLLDFSFLRYFTFPFSFFGQSLQKATSFSIESKSKLGSPEFQSSIISVIKGIIIALPILVLFGLLLFSADIVFQRYLDNLLKTIIDIDPEIALRMLIVLAFFYFFIGFFVQISANKKEENLLNGDKKFNFWPIESSVILGGVGLLFLIFILIQFVYLFGGREYIWGIEEHITYAEYARRGFGELIAVSLISLFLIYGIDKFGIKESIFQKRTFKILSSVLILQLFVIMVSAFKRLSLYIDGYGFTFSRLLGLTFLLWLFLIFLFFLFKIIYEKKETLFLFSTFWLTIIFLIGLNIFNPDAFIARKNIERYTQGKELDVWYLNQLSDDAIPEIVKIFGMDKVNDEIKMDLAIGLYHRYQAWYYRALYYRYRYYLIEEEIVPFDEKLERIKEEQKWQSFNLSKNKALTVLLENSNRIKEYQIKYREREEAR
jgi:hypothetical protein